MKKIFSILLFAFVCLTSNAHCSSLIEDRQRNSLELWTLPCETYGVSQALAIAIARVESQLNPWAVNIEGKSFFYDSYEDALAASNTAFSMGKSFDIGLMQINSYWLRRFKLAPNQVLDPQYNVTLGVWILAKEIERYGLSWEAVGSYHTPIQKNPKNAQQYVKNVRVELEAMSKGVE